ncbi:TetR family transcriptional regulator [Streptomyces sp. SID335]|nr:TetR family transcriptional regulator [Streptomyces sp. SID335]MYZ13359.1 TetR family transcriptional regulator [Streptomyces sp. SID337]NDZ89267.1 TetR/AcrR family transcriptional regulator [Streptomyces sp. SID10115]NEA03019.1 TetR/AcrR family transcriptional regulator [Streptomyces sp. SID10116]NEB49745.1 TetR/AcrR family transcriptional regulator [Streptomyces sp. SID339]
MPCVASWPNNAVLQEILDTAAEVLRTSDACSFSVPKLAAALGTDSSSLYRHFRNKSELLSAVADRILLAAMDGYHPDGDWKQRITALALRLREAFGEQPQLAAVWGHYGSGGAGSRLVMEELMRALRASGLPDSSVKSSPLNSPTSRPEFPDASTDSAQLPTPVQCTQRTLRLRCRTSIVPANL